MALRGKKERRITKKMQIKLMAIFAFILLVLVGLNIRIAYITAKSGDQYAKQVLSQQRYDSRTIPYRRGEIQDRNGNIIARSEKVYNVVLDCFAINSDEDYIEPTIEAVASTLGVEEAVIRQHITAEETKDSQYQVIKRKATAEEKQKYDDYTDLSEDKKLTDSKRQDLENVQGVWFEEDFVRTYPMNSLGSTIVGFSNSLNDGISGLEAHYTDVLNGVNGREYGYLNEESQLQRTIIEPTNGNSIISTIDVNVQEVIEKYIKQFDEANKNGPWEESAGHGSQNTGVIVADPNTGEILGMGTNQSYDLNEPENLEGWYTEEEIKAMTDEEYVEALNGRWKNFCVSDAFELGSTYKPIVVSAALEMGATTDDSSYVCGGSLLVAEGEAPINCDYTLGHGPETLSDVIKNSCNVGMMHIGAQMGIDEFLKQQDLFNFGKRTGIDLPNEGAGQLHTKEIMGVMELATDTFGQGFTSTMIQELAAFNTVVNGGYYYRPHMVKQVLDSKGSVVKNIEPILMNQPISSKNSALLREYLEQGVIAGTGTKAQIPGYRIGGKTGTAETIPRNEDRYVVSFIGAVPIDNPQVVIYAVIDQPNVDNQETGGYTMELSKNILSEILPYLGIYPTEEITEEEQATLGMQVETETPETDEYGNIVPETNADGTPVVQETNADGTAAYIDEPNNDFAPGNEYPEPPVDTGGEGDGAYPDAGLTDDALMIGQ